MSKGSQAVCESCTLVCCMSKGSQAVCESCTLVCCMSKGSQAVCESCTLVCCMSKRSQAVCESCTFLMLAVSEHMLLKMMQVKVLCFFPSLLLLFFEFHVVTAKLLTPV